MAAVVPDLREAAGQNIDADCGIERAKVSQGLLGFGLVWCDDREPT
jgi:hypothetical protein